MSTAVCARATDGSEMHSCRAPAARTRSLRVKGVLCDGPGVSFLRGMRRAARRTTSSRRNCFSSRRLPSRQMLGSSPTTAICSSRMAERAAAGGRAVRAGDRARPGPGRAALPVDLRSRRLARTGTGDRAVRTAAGGVAALSCGNTASSPRRTWPGTRTRGRSRSSKLVFPSPSMTRPTRCDGGCCTPIRTHPRPAASSSSSDQ